MDAFMYSHMAKFTNPQYHQGVCIIIMVGDKVSY